EARRPERRARSPEVVRGVQARRDRALAEQDDRHDRLRSGSPAADVGLMAAVIRARLAPACLAIALLVSARAASADPPLAPPPPADGPPAPGGVRTVPEDELVVHALAQNPTLKAAQREHAVAKAGERVATMIENPTLRLEWLHAGTDPKVSQSASAVQDRTGFGV